MNDVTFRIKEKNSSKQQIVHYDRLKPFFGAPPTSNVPSRNKSRNFQLNQDIADTHKHIDGKLIHDDCLIFLPAPSSIFTPIHAIGGTTVSIPKEIIRPITFSAATKREAKRSPLVFLQSPAPEQPCLHREIDVAIQSLSTLQIDIQPLIPGNAFLHKKQPQRENITEIVDAAARNLRRTTPANTSKK